MIINRELRRKKLLILTLRKNCDSHQNHTRTNINIECTSLESGITRDWFHTSPKENMSEYEF